MPISNDVRRATVTVHSNKGNPRKQVLEDVRSVLEVSDEENETIRGISFHTPDGWKDFEFDNIDRIVITPHRPKTGGPSFS